jgi:hypothetical protein
MRLMCAVRSLTEERVKGKSKGHALNVKDRVEPRELVVRSESAREPGHPESAGCGRLL